MSSQNEYFNIDNFKKWMNNHPQSEQETGSVVGVEVQARFGAKKTMRNMTVESGKVGRVIREFMSSGGTIKSVDENYYLVEVASGSFTINKKMVVI